MAESTLNDDVGRICDRLDATRALGSRVVIGVAGPPASGKSSLAEALVKRLNESEPSNPPTACLLPMDGYHLDNRLLADRGLLPRKGAPETFNSHGFCDAIRAAKETTRESFHPVFNRDLDLSIAHAVTLDPATPIIVVEGNYLLLKAAPWSSLADVFDLTVFVSPSLATLEERLIQRWTSHGFDLETAREKASGNDLPNAKLVLRESRDADMTFTQGE